MVIKYSNIPIRKGLTLIEAALVLGITSLVMAGLVQGIESAAENNKSKAAADKLNEVAEAAQLYLKTNQTVLLNNTTVGGPAVVVPVATGTGPGGLLNMKDAGFLPSTYQDKNSYAQSHSLLVKQVSTPSGTSHLEAMIVTTGGNKIPDRQVGRVGRFLGAQAGFVMANPPAGLTGKILGVSGGWAADISNWTASGVTPTAGHVMAVLSTADMLITGDYLVRNDIGIPEVNTMRTNIDMAQNGLTEVASVTNTTSADQTVEIGPNVHIPGTMKADTQVQSGGDVLAAGNVYGAGFFDVSNNSYYMIPSGETNINDLKTQSISLDTVVYGTSRGINQSQGIKLGDLLGHYISYGGYGPVNDGDGVPMPTCGIGGTPKIVLNYMQDSYSITPNMSWQPLDAGSPFGTLSGTYLNSCSLTSDETSLTLTCDGTQNSDIYIKNGLNLVSNLTVPTGGTQIARKISALPFGNIWKIFVSGSAFVAGYEGTVLATTYCYYP